MRKDELKALFGEDAGGAAFGPIADQLHAMATERELPDAAIAICAVRHEESVPPLRALLIKAAGRVPLSEGEELLLFRGLHILGGIRDSLSCSPLLRLLRRPSGEIDRLLGDGVTESLASIVSGVFDGDVEALFEAISDRSIDEFVREALLGSASFLTWDGRIEPARMHAFLVRFCEEKLAEDEDQAWIGWLQAVALLGLRDLAPLVYRAWDEGRVPDGVLERRHFDKDLLDAELRPDDPERFRENYLGYIEDVIVSLDWTRGSGWDEDRDDWDDEDDPEPLWSEQTAPMTPAVNPWRHVGRNDPCPCGSGKKAKKCCLGS